MKAAIDDLQEFFALGGTCRACDRECWFDHHEVRRKWGDAGTLDELYQRARLIVEGDDRAS